MSSATVAQRREGHTIGDYPRQTLADLDGQARRARAAMPPHGEQPAGPRLSCRQLRLAGIGRPIAPLVSFLLLLLREMGAHRDRAPAAR